MNALYPDKPRSPVAKLDQDFAFADIDRGGVAVLQTNSTEVNTRLRLDGD